MHASLSGSHISGAERLVTDLPQAEETLQAMLQRALEHPRGRADRVSLQVEEIAGSSVVSGTLLSLSGFQVSDWQTGRLLATRLLQDAGVTRQAAAAALETLAAGAAPDGSSMRGAMLVDACSGARLETDPFRGVRVSRMDLTGPVREQLKQQLARLGLDNQHVIEALTLASKVLSAPQVIAELCWSDDPHYLAGYVATATGYQRIERLKPAGDSRGGRAFFLRDCGPDLPALIDYLENTPLLIERLGTCEQMVNWTP